MMTISPDQLIPPDSDLAQMLMQWSEDTDSRTWNIANLTNDLIAELEGGQVTRTDIYKAVAARCKGQKPNTIRRWAEVAADFSPELQRKYAQLLSFQHFRTARRLLKEELVPDLEYPLAWCVSGDDDKLTAGRFHTVGEMLNNFLPEEFFQNQLNRIWQSIKEKLYDQFLIVDHDNFREQLLQNWKEIDYIVKEIQALDTDK